MQLTQSEKIKLVIGAIIGAVLGVGTVWTLMQSPTETDADGEIQPISAKEILTLTGAAAALIRGLADFRRKL